MADNELTCADALIWLRGRETSGIVTSLPDAEEIGQPIRTWSDWFLGAAKMCMASTGDRHAAVFYQTDRKHEWSVASKAELLFRAAKELGRKILWHKIVLRRGVGVVDMRRPGYTHMLAFGGSESRPGRATPDVIERGEMLYDNAMGAGAVSVALDLISLTSSHVTDPFCGRGSVLVAAARRGMCYAGADISQDQINEASRNLDANRTLFEQP